MTTRGCPRWLARRLLPAVGVVVPLMFSSGAAVAQRLGQGADDDVSVWRVVAALLLCMVLAVVGAFILKSGGWRGLPAFVSLKRGNRLRLVESLRVGNQAELCIVVCDGRELLVSSSAQGIALLKQLPMDKVDAVVDEAAS